MKIGEILRKIADAVDQSDGINPGATPDGRLQNPAELIAVQTSPERQNEVDTPDGISPEGLPDQMFVPPLQQKLELLKKAVGIPNVFDNAEEIQDKLEAENNIPTPSELDELEQLKKAAGMPYREAAIMQELTNDEPLDD
jgi:hypothetical protein